MVWWWSQNTINLGLNNIERREDPNDDGYLSSLSLNSLYYTCGIITDGSKLLVKEKQEIEQLTESIRS